MWLAPIIESSALLFYDIELRLQHWFRIKIQFCGLNETQCIGFFSTFDRVEARKRKYRGNTSVQITNSKYAAWRRTGQSLQADPGPGIQMVMVMVASARHVSRVLWCSEPAAWCYDFVKKIYSEKAIVMSPPILYIYIIYILKHLTTSSINQLLSAACCTLNSSKNCQTSLTCLASGG